MHTFFEKKPRCIQYGRSTDESNFHYDRHVVVETFRYKMVRHSAIGYDRNFRLVTLLPSSICNATPERMDCDLVSTDPNRAIRATRSSTFRDIQATL